MRPLLSESLPYVPATHFLRQMTVPERRLWFFLAAALWMSLAWTAWSVVFPPGETYELTEETPFAVTVQKTTRLNRTFVVEAQAATAVPSFGAQAVLPSNASLIVFVVLLVTGWAVLTAATSHLAGPYAYVFYFIFCVGIYQSELARWVGGTVGDWREKAVAFGFMLLYLIPAYAFRSRTWVKSLRFQFVFWALWMAMWYGVQAAVGGWPALHRAAAYPMLSHVGLLILAALFVSKDLLHAVVMTFNNVSDPKRRRSAAWIFGTCALVIVALLLAYLRAYLILPEAEGLSLRPLWFFVFAAGLTPVLSQNFYRPFQGYFSSPLGFSMLIVGGATVPAAAWGYYAAAGEWVFVREAERLVATVFLVAAVVQFFYLLVNYGGDIQRKKNVYFVLPVSKTNFPFAAVWFAAAAVLIVQSGRQNWHNFYGFYVSMLNQYADEAWRKGEIDQALLWYEQATEYHMVDPKSNHNWATLSAGTVELLEDAETIEKIEHRYAEADRVNDFAYSAMGWGNFLRLTYRQKEAVQMLRKAAGRRKDYRLYCNLAAGYLGVERPDSALWALRQAERWAPDEPTVAAALAGYFQSQSRPDSAFHYAKIAFRKAPRYSPAVQNYFAVALSRDTVVDVSDFSSADTSVLSPAAAYHAALGALRTGRRDLAADLLAPVARDENPEAAFAYFLARLPLDEPSLSLARKKWIAHRFPEYAPALERAMAVFCFEKHAPECAAAHFRAAGTLQDRYFAALMDLEAGDDFHAYDSLMAIAAEDTLLAPACKREMAMLEAAHKTGHEQLLWDFSDLTPDEALRWGRYAGRIGHLDVTTRVYDVLIKADTLSVQPYIEIGKLFLLNGNARGAVEQYLAGLPRDPQNYELRYELARAYHYAGRKKSADSLASLLNDPRLNLEIRPDPLALRDYAFRYPWDSFAVRRTARFFIERDSIESGLRLMHRVLDFNRHLAEWWAYYGYFNEKTGFSEEAEFAYESAWKCEFRDSLKNRYFADYERIRQTRTPRRNDD